MRENAGFGHLRTAAGLALAATVAECAIAQSYIAGRPAWWIPLAAHLAVAAGLAAWCRRTARRSADLRLPLLVAVSTAALGPVGAGGTLLAIALVGWYARTATPFEEWYRSLFPATGPDAGSELLSRIEGSAPEEAGKVSAFADILALGSLQQKQALIALISRQFRPAFGPILKKALTDSHSAVRVQAATAVSKLENTILGRTLDLSRRARENPGDVTALRALARHYDDYLYRGILDARREEEVRGLALAAYRRCAAADAGDLGSRLAAGRILLRGRSYAEAAEWLDQAIEAGPSTPQAALWYMESLFHLGRFDALRHLARDRREDFENLTDFPAGALAAVKLWAGETPVPGGSGGPS
jgi:polysaccharide biosynthesis protein PelE